jgi:hypothetical protein
MKSIIICAFFVIGLINGIQGIPTGKKTENVAANKKSGRTAEDDSDMLMEPDEYEPRVFTPLNRDTNDNGFKPIIQPYKTIERSTSTSSLSSTTESQDSNDPAAQNYYPFFRDSTALGHSRPYYPSQQQDIQAIPQYNNIPRSRDQTVLGSGDFGVIRGGTFYQDSDPPFHGGENSDYYNYYLNGHGRPHSANYVPKNFYGDDQFANFRDFADLNSPGEPAYSEFVVVYANKNATNTNIVHHNPKNIFEQLELLDKEKKQDEIERKEKISKIKRKLQKTKLVKKYNKIKLGVKETGAEDEPLLALS